MKGAWTIEHEEEINALCSWLYIIRMFELWQRWAGDVARLREIRNAYKVSW